MYFTEEELREVVASATWHTLRSLGIVSEDDLYASTDVLELLSASKGHRNALTEFRDAYIAWYDFHLKIYKAGKSGDLSDGESTTLKNLIDRRDRARRTLVEITG